MEYIKEMLQEAGLSKTEASKIAKKKESLAAWLKKAVCAMDAVSVINREANLANAGLVEYSETLDDMDECEEHIEKILELTEDILGSTKSHRICQTCERSGLTRSTCFARLQMTS